MRPHIRSKDGMVMNTIFAIDPAEGFSLGRSF